MILITGDVARMYGEYLEKRLRYVAKIAYFGKGKTEIS
jgi:hypothetical protein